MLKLNKESLKNLSAMDKAQVQGGYYQTLWKCATEDNACLSIYSCPASAFSCDTITVENC